jgi:hypothetical protein
MPKPPLPYPEEPVEDASDDAALDADPDLIDDEPPVDDPRVAPSPRGHGPALKIAAIVALVLVVGGSLMAYRAHHRRKALRAGLERAEQLLRLDTAAGYQEAAALLEPLAELDPLEAGSARAFALAMLFADYRVGRAEAEAEALLVRPGRAAEIPRQASLAQAALGLGRRFLGDATAAASAAQGSRWANVLQARIALAAGALPSAVEPAAAAAADGRLAAGLAVHGDVVRRARRDAAAARLAYAAALTASPTHPRAAYGLAKLALAGDVPFTQAAAPLERLLADVAGTPAPERGRAALHLAALRLRAGDRPGAEAALAAARLDAPTRAWAERAATIAANRRGPYQAVAGAPPALQSASDDDPPELSATPPAEVTPVAAAPAPRPAASPPIKKAAAVRGSAHKPASRAKATSRRTAGTAKKAAAAKTKSSRKAVVRKRTR